MYVDAEEPVSKEDSEVLASGRTFLPKVKKTVSFESSFETSREREKKFVISRASSSGEEDRERPIYIRISLISKYLSQLWSILCRRTLRKKTLSRLSHSLDTWFNIKILCFLRHTKIFKYSIKK